MLKVFGFVAAVVAPTLAFGQGTSVPSSASPAPQPTRVETVPAPALVPIRKIDPTYPEKARRAGIQGEVWLDVIVRADGTVGNVLVGQSLDTVFGLDQAAIVAVRQWQYPPLTDGRASRPPLRVVVPFLLPNAAPAAPRVVAEEFDDSALRPTRNDPRVVAPKPRRPVPPTYTSAGLRAKIVGQIEIEAVVLADGTVGQVRVVKSLDKATGLDDQALGAAREWTFEPGTLDGTPVPMIVSLVLAFNLR